MNVIKRLFFFGENKLCPTPSTTNPMALKRSYKRVNRSRHFYGFRFVTHRSASACVCVSLSFIYRAQIIFDISCWALLRVFPGNYPSNKFRHRFPSADLWTFTRYVKQLWLAHHHRRNKKCNRFVRIGRGRGLVEMQRRKIHLFCRHTITFNSENVF